jgi:hypothetical protein
LASNDARAFGKIVQRTRTGPPLAVTLKHCSLSLPAMHSSFVWQVWHRSSRHTSPS